jgi:hypothetical protein
MASSCSSAKGSSRWSSLLQQQPTNLTPKYTWWVGLVFTLVLCNSEFVYFSSDCYCCYYHTTSLSLSIRSWRRGRSSCKTVFFFSPFLLMKTSNTQKPKLQNSLWLIKPRLQSQTHKNLSQKFIAKIMDGRSFFFSCRKFSLLGAYSECWAGIRN